MSLLLDALRKSEAQRRAGETPGLDLGTGNAPAGSRQPGHRAGGRLDDRLGWLLVLLVLVGGGAGLAWWQPWSPWFTSQIDEPLALAEPPAPPRQTAVAAEATVATAMRPAEMQDPIPPAPAPVRQPTVEAGSGAEPEIQSRVRAQADPLAAAGPDSVDARPETAPGQRARAADDGSSEIETAAPTTAVIDANVGPDRSAAAEVAPPAPVEQASGADPAEAASAPAAAPEQRDASLDGVIRPWELPQDLRAEFPNIRLTVHFYAGNPADRFVLIDGERRGEGASLGSGVRIEEIRKRGLIVEFRNYRILIE